MPDFLLVFLIVGLFTLSLVHYANYRTISSWFCGSLSFILLLWLSFAIGFMLKAPPINTFSLPIINLNNQQIIEVDGKIINITKEYQIIIKEDIVEVQQYRKQYCGVYFTGNKPREYVVNIQPNLIYQFP